MASGMDRILDISQIDNFCTILQAPLTIETKQRSRYGKAVESIKLIMFLFTF